MMSVVSFILCVFLLLAVPVSSIHAKETPTPSPRDELQVATPSSTLPPEPRPIPSTPLNISLSPVSLSLETDPGVPVTSEMKIRNNSTSDELLQITLGTFTADETGQKPKLLDVQEGDEFITWLKPQETRFVVQAGEWKTIPIVFSPPKDASLAYYYTIIVSRSSKSETKGGETGIIGAPSILTLATVRSPHAKRELQLVDFRAKYPILEYVPQEFTIRVKNSGNVHMVPAGNIFIDGQGKKDVGIILLNPNRSAILPQSERNYDVEWNDGFPRSVKKIVDGKDSKNSKGEQEYTLQWDFSTADRFRFGKYTAHLLMVYDNGERDIPIESFVSFWVIPWKILSIVIFVLLLVIVGFGSIVFLLLKTLRRKNTQINTTDTQSL